MTKHLIPLTGDWSTTLWYAPDSGASADLGSVEECGSCSIRRSRLSRKMVDRLAMRAQLPLGSLMNLSEADIAWSPDFTLPPVHARQRAVTVHDLAWMEAPEYAPPGLRSFLDGVVPREINRADHLFTVSETIQVEISVRFPAVKDRIVVAPNGVDPRFREAGRSPNRTILRDLGLPDGYLLMVGTLEPRKNHKRVFAALRGMPIDVPLVVAGGRGWLDDQILLEMDELSPKVRYLGFVPDHLLPQLYANAVGLLAVSVYEGFDLPLLEALAAGIPVLASDIPVHHEIAEDLPHYCDPLRVDAMQDGIIRVVSGRNEDQRHEIRRDAIVSRYQWQASASRVWETFRDLA